MSKRSDFLESPATPYEDSFDYRVEWDAKIEWIGWAKTKRLGPGYEIPIGFDNAWDSYNYHRRSGDYIHVRLIRIDKDGNETIYAK